MSRAFFIVAILVAAFAGIFAALHSNTGAACMAIAYLALLRECATTIEEWDRAIAIASEALSVAEGNGAALRKANAALQKAEAVLTKALQP